MDKKEAQQFVRDWLWSSDKRITSGMTWVIQYINDTASMIIDATNNIESQLAAQSALLKEAERVLEAVAIEECCMLEISSDDIAELEISSVKMVPLLKEQAQDLLLKLREGREEM